jgi:penicillin-binding protein 1A
VADTAAAGIGFTLRLALKVLVTILLIFITTGLIFTCIFAIYVKTCLTEEELNISLEEASLALSSTIWYEDSNGDLQVLATLYSDENRSWVDYEDIPINLEHAAVAIEDQRFYVHKGVDWYRTIAAFANMFVSMADNFGGSTITQQLIKNVTEYDDVTVQRKLLEIFRALEFEKIYTKSEIMTWYLNEIYLGEGCYGVATAAQMYFGKDVSELDLAECASLIGITNNPSLYDPYVSDRARERNKERQETILWEMYDQGYITYDEYIQAVNEELNFQQGTEFTRTTEVYSYYVDTVIRDVISDLAEAKGISERQAEHLLYNGGYNIYSCIDMRIQDIVDSVYENPSNLPSAYRSTSQSLQSAIVIIDPYNGDIVALSGGVGEKTVSLSGNHATEYTHPPGSSLKPLSVYAPALDLGLVTQYDEINDTPNYTLSGTTWYPKNSGNSYAGWTTIREALQRSRNTVAAQLLDKLGLQTSWDYLTNHFGLTSLVKDKYIEDEDRIVTDYAYSPLALGQLSYGVTVREMAQAYTAFVNDGIMTYGRTYYMITDDEGEIVYLNSSKQVSALKANTAWNMCDMLQNAVANGTGTDAYFSSTAVAGKTGTTTQDYDRYFVGFTMYYVAAVWTGHESNETMYYSGNPAAQIFKTIMSQVHSGLAYKSFPTATIGTTTNIFGDAEEEEEEEVEATETPEPTETPAATETPTPTEPPAAATTAPATEVPVATEAPATEAPATEPPPATEAPVATEPPPAATEPPPAIEEPLPEE